MRRLFDVVVSAAALVVLAPFLAFVALLVKMTSSGPVFYRGRRVGRNGRVFDILKFRTMVNHAAGPAITRNRDPRVTSLGRLFRRTKIDELPQLINVLRGEMSLLGPRPEAEEYVRLYTDDERRVLSVRPGITSRASLQFRAEEALLDSEHWYEQYVTSVMRAKLRQELHDLDNPSLVSDVRVLLETVLVFFGR